MTPNQIQLIRMSFDKVRPITEEAAVLFYARLFELDPTLRSLFQADIREQGHKLMQIIGYAIDSLDDLDNLVPTLRDLGTRHVEYGVKSGHYETVGVAFLWTLRKALKDYYTDDVDGAWNALYSFLAAEMIRGAEAPAGRPIA